MIDDPLISVSVWADQDGNVGFDFDAPDSLDDYPEGVNPATTGLAVAGVCRVVGRFIEEQSVVTIEEVL